MIMEDKMIYVGYNRRSSVTGRLLADELGARRISDKRFKYKPDVFLRWGNSYLEAPESAVEINSIESVQNAANKLKMAKILSSAEGVPFPKVWFFDRAEDEIIAYGDGNQDEFNSLLSGGLYFRNSFNQARLRNHYVEGDLYAIEKVSKVREFRVHIWESETLGVYEKIPYEGNPTYWKDDVCAFKRLDMSNKSITAEIKGVRPASKLAVKALGLVFGGVDVMMDEEGAVWVNEVNSAPALNSENIKRFSEKIKQYVNERI